MMPGRLRRIVHVNVRGKSAWMLIANVWKRTLMRRNSLLAFVLDDLLRLGACSEVPDGLGTDISSDAYVLSICAS